jgi:hypothetical protein
MAWLAGQAVVPRRVLTIIQRSGKSKLIAGMLAFAVESSIQGRRLLPNRRAFLSTLRRTRGFVFIRRAEERTRMRQLL